ncbi:ATP-dependent DNA ligase [Paenibacillus glycanilyticus]|nr:ATP-dependent DNA ligase [Paenibacillus glycanilyticus]
MLLNKAEEPFDSNDYLFEPKFDGQRLIVSFIKGQVNMYTRHNNDVTRQYPELFNVPVDSHMDVVLDGEVVRVREDGTNDFEGLIQRFQLGKQTKIREASRTHPVQYFAFDILYLNGKSLIHLPLLKRKEILAQVLIPNHYYHLTLSIEQQGIALYKAIKHKGLDGIVAKRKNSKYVGKRSESWLKVMNYQYAEVAISGYSRNEFGWLVEYEGQHAGIIDLSVPVEARKAFFKAASSIITGQDKHYVYVKPILKVKVRFRNWTSNNRLRSPEYVGFAGEINGPQAILSG